MGARLSRRDADESYCQVHELLRDIDFETYTMAKVVAMQGNNCLFDDTVRIDFTDRLQWYDVNIAWEDVAQGVNYKAQGLYGYYSSGYARMEHEHKQLTIHADDGIVITIQI